MPRRPEPAFATALAPTPFPRLPPPPDFRLRFPALPPARLPNGFPHPRAVVPGAAFQPRVPFFGNQTVSLKLNGPIAGPRFLNKFNRGVKRKSGELENTVPEHARAVTIDGVKIVIPTEMCQPLCCKLCDVKTNAVAQARAHYGGKQHLKKARQYAENIRKTQLQGDSMAEDQPNGDALGTGLGTATSVGERPAKKIKTQVRF